MPATALSRADLRSFLRESWRYGLASALALAADIAVYLALLRLAGVHYLVAAPLGFLVGLAAIYVLSARWAFSVRRYGDARIEFALFALIGLEQAATHKAAIHAGVTGLALSPEMAKLASAALVFCFNFSARKFLLFTRYGGGA